LNKCTFCKDTLFFLGFLVGKNGVQVVSESIKVIQKWPTLKIVEVSSFHGLVGFYKRFVPNFSTIATPLNDIVKKDVPLCWVEKQEKPFQSLKDSLTHAPVLVFVELKALMSPNP